MTTYASATEANSKVSTVYIHASVSCWGLRHGTVAYMKLSLVELPSEHECSNRKYVVPENIQTLTTEGIGNFEGVGSKTQEIPEVRGLAGQFSSLKMFSWRRLYESWRWFGFRRYVLSVLRVWSRSRVSEYSSLKKNGNFDAQGCHDRMRWCRSA